MRSSRCGSSMKHGCLRSIGNTIHIEVYGWSLAVGVTMFALSAGVWGYSSLAREDWR